MYRAESMMPDPIALSPLGCAHQGRMRTYEVRSYLFVIQEMIAEVLTKRVPQERSDEDCLND